MELFVDKLSKSYGERLLFEDISFSLEKGQKVALVARNGAGKSTLLNIIAGIEPPDSGQLVRSRDLNFAYLLQDSALDPEHSVAEAIFSQDTPAAQALKTYEEALDAADTDKIAQALEQVERHQAWEWQVQAHQVLTELKIAHLQQPVKSLSGGQQRRIALAKILIARPDVLILDEPTNHLDLDMIEWLEEYLTQSHLTLLLVTHDRYFLERVCDDILELDNQQLYRYQGNYSLFLEQKSQREANETKEWEDARRLMKKEYEWVRKQPRARGTKAKARLQAFDELQRQVLTPKNKQELSLTITGRRLGGKVLEVEHLSKSFGNQCILKDFSHVFKRGERMGIVGANGVGKSTFLELLTGGLAPDAGQIIAGETVVISYYRQVGPNLPADRRVIEVVREVAEFLPVGPKGELISASQLLERFLFPPPLQYTPVGRLSGGERKRLYLLMLLLQNPNVLVFDEPTNDLDLLTIQILEDFLLEFQGCLLVVSHDRYFMDKLIDHLLIFEGHGQVRDFPGNYSDYRLELEYKQEQARQQEKAQAPPPPPLPQPVEKPRLTWKQQRELESLEPELAELEQRKQTVSAQLSNTQGLGAGTLQKLATEFGEIESAIAAKEERWMALSLLKEGSI